MAFLHVMPTQPHSHPHYLRLSLFLLLIFFKISSTSIIFWTQSEFVVLANVYKDTIPNKILSVCVKILNILKRKNNGLIPLWKISVS